MGYIMPKTHIIILAGGKGTRMNADFPKVLFKIKEKPMIGYLLEKV
ncbi:MAG: NTP transferase domain-containing protein, partial [Patescibacteria group bacterium]|nr:NTP transferase domain-containing protein [Patescibacteria group bacterium]